MCTDSHIILKKLLCICFLIWNISSFCYKNKSPLVLMPAIKIDRNFIDIQHYSLNIV